MKLGIVFCRACFILLGCFGCCDNFWWSPREVPVVKGFVDSYQITTNSSGDALCMINQQVVGVFNASNDSWTFYRVNLEQGAPSIYPIHQFEASTISTEESHFSQYPFLNDFNEGSLIFKINEGPDSGKVAYLEYKENSFSGFKILSDGEVQGLSAAMTDYGTGVVVWINNNPSSSNYKKLEACYKSLDEWSASKALCNKESVEFTYQQAGPKIALSEIGDGVVVWKVKSETSELEGDLMVACFDGIEQKWLSSKVIGAQNLDYKRFDLSLNSTGDAALTWFDENKIQLAYVNISDYTIASEGGNEEEMTSSDWKKIELNEALEVQEIKSAVSSEKTILLCWVLESQGAKYALIDMKENHYTDLGQVTPKSIFDMSLCFNENRFKLAYLGEGSHYDETLFYREFDSKGCSIGQIKTLSNMENSLVDSAQGVSFGKAGRGVVMWYDFLKDKLFLAYQKNVEEPRFSDRYRRLRDKSSFLIERKLRLAEKRAQRRG